MMMRTESDVVASKHHFFISNCRSHQTDMPKIITNKLLIKSNLKDTSGIHGIFAMQLRMRVRLLDGLDRNKILMKYAERRVCVYEIYPLVKMAVDATMVYGGTTVYLHYIRFGIWLQINKYKEYFFQALQFLVNSFDLTKTHRLFFVGP